MKLIVGLGNPGEKYRNTRHNIGFKVIDRLAKYYSIKLKDEKGFYTFGRGKIEGGDVILAKPLTYMNKSGEAVQAIMHYYRVSPNDLILIYDDIDLETGRLRIRTQGGCGGHRGCTSVASLIGTDEFNRLRIGIGRPVHGNDVVNYVLSEFSASETGIMENSVESATDAIRMILRNDLSGAMNKYNLKGE